MTDRRQRILNTVDDCVSKLLYYDRKEDEDLGVGEIDKSIIIGEISVDEICQFFKKKFIEGLQI